MKTKCYAIGCADGTVAIMQCVEQPDGSFPTPEQCIAKWPAAQRATVVGRAREIDRSSIPSDRTFRNAWGHDLAVDMPKARDIWRERMREARAPKLAALDVEYMRAHERQDAAALESVAAAKQALRDVTADPAIETARTPEELKAVWPECLSRMDNK